MQPRLLDLHPATVSKLSRLQKEAERDGAYRVAKRIHSVVLCANGHTSGEISDLLQPKLLFPLLKRLSCHLHFNNSE